MSIEAMKQALEILERKPSRESYEARCVLRRCIQQLEKKEATLQEISDIEQEIEQVHTDHPARHWDRTCPACVAESSNSTKTVRESVTCSGLQEPVAWMFEEYGESSGGMRWFKCLGTEKPQHPESIYRNIIPLYTAPPKREWVGLTDQEIWEADGLNDLVWGRNIEAKLREKNT